MPRQWQGNGRQGGPRGIDRAPTIHQGPGSAAERMWPAQSVRGPAAQVDVETAVAGCPAGLPQEGVGLGLRDPWHCPLVLSPGGLAAATKVCYFVDVCCGRRALPSSRRGCVPAKATFPLGSKVLRSFIVETGLQTLFSYKTGLFLAFPVEAPSWQGARGPGFLIFLFLVLHWDGPSQDWPACLVVAQVMIGLGWAREGEGLVRVLLQVPPPRLCLWFKKLKVGGEAAASAAAGPSRVQLGSRSGKGLQQCLLPALWAPPARVLG